MVIEAVWKIEAIRLIAPIARITHDIGIAELLGLRVSRSDLTPFDYPGFRGIDAGIRAAKGEFLARAAQRTLKLPRDLRTSDWSAPYRTPAGRDAILAAYGQRFHPLLGRRDAESGRLIRPWPSA